MKKWIRYLLILAAIPMMSFGGFGGEDVGRLSPAQVVLLRQRDQVMLRTDTKELGIGEDVEKAIRNMKDTSQHRIFLDTADYLLIEPGAEMWIDQLQEYLRPSCNICYIVGEVDPEQAGQFLQRHKPMLTLTEYKAGNHRLPCLTVEKGRMQLEQS